MAIFGGDKRVAAERAFVMAAIAGAESEVYIPYIQTRCEDAAKETCRRISKTPEYLRIQDSFAATLDGAGTAVLQEAVMVETCRDSRGGRVTHASYARPLVYTPRIGDLYLPQPGAPTDNSGQGELGYFTYRGGAGGGGVIYAGNANGEPLSGNIIVLACTLYPFADMPSETEPLYLEVLIEMARSKRS